MRLDVNKVVTVDAKILSIYCKVSDNFTATLLDETGEELCNQDQDYVPSFMPGEHFGDYIMLDIDIDTGMITNWKPPTKEALRAWIDKCHGGDE